MAVLNEPVLFRSASSPRTVLLFVKQPSWQVARTCGQSAQQASASAVKNKPYRKGDRLVEFLVSEVFVFINNVSFSRGVNSATAGLNEGKKLSGEATPPGFRSGF